MKKSLSVTLKPGAVRRIAGRYPFGHAGDIASHDAGIAPGEVVDVRDPGGPLVGRGYFNPEGATPLRMLTWDKRDIDLAFYRERVRAALKRREGRITGTDAVRAVYAEADGLPGVRIIPRRADGSHRSSGRDDEAGRVRDADRDEQPHQHGQRHADDAASEGRANSAL